MIIIMTFANMKVPVAQLLLAQMKKTRTRAINYGLVKCKLHAMHCSGQCYVVYFAVTNASSQII